MRWILGLAVVVFSVEAKNGAWAQVAKWRGMHSSGIGAAVGMCTAELVAKDWVITAGHCATRILKKEKVHVQLTFAESHNPTVKRGTNHCVKANGMDVDVALCKLTTAVGAFKPFVLNSDIYRTNKPAKHAPHGVYTVGTSGGYHVEGPKALEYEGNGAHLYVHKKATTQGGLGMKAGDSGGAWVEEVSTKVANVTKTLKLLTGVIHGGSKTRGIAAQIGFMRSWIDKTTGHTATWASATNKSTWEGLLVGADDQVTQD